MAGPRCTAALLVLVTVLVAGCGSSPAKERRDAVNAYLDQVSSAQVGLLGREGEIDTVLQGFSLTRPTPKELHGLASGEATVDKALGRLRALDPPPAARRLQTLLVRRLALQRSVLGGLVQATAYIPKLDAPAAALQAAAARLQHQLRELSASPSSSVPATGSQSALALYAAAFGGYGDALKPVGERLAALRPPALLAPGHDAELGAVRRSISLCAEIRSALLRRDIHAANTAIHDLFGGSQAASDLQARKAQLAAERAYDAQLRRINALAVQVSRERTRLVASIG